MAEIVLGIDLGTTNTCAAIVDGEQARVIEQKGGYRTLPSIVAFNPDGSKSDRAYCQATIRNESGKHRSCGKATHRKTL